MRNVNCSFCNEVAIHKCSKCESKVMCEKHSHGNGTFVHVCESCFVSTKIDVRFNNQYLWIFLCLCFPFVIVCPWLMCLYELDKNKKGEKSSNFRRNFLIV